MTQPKFWLCEPQCNWPRQQLVRISYVAFLALILIAQAQSRVISVLYTGSKLNTCIVTVNLGIMTIADF